jgi:hypothetical protein
MVIGSSLTAVAKAQAIAAAATLNFVKSLCEEKDGVLVPAALKLQVERQSTTAAGTTSTSQATVNAPLLAIVPIPHLLVDSVTINFKYEVSQTYQDKSATSTTAEAKVGTTGLLSKFVEATFHGNLAHTSSSEQSTNRGGTLEIMVRASQSAMPVGLDRLITMLSQAITPSG